MFSFSGMKVSGMEGGEGGTAVGRRCRGGRVGTARRTGRAPPGTLGRATWAEVGGRPGRRIARADTGDGRKAA